MRVQNFFTMIDYLCDSGITGMDIAIVTAYRSEILDDRAAKLRAGGNEVTFIDIRELEAAV